MATVVSCTGCERFVQSSDSECPFCGTARTPRAVSLRRPQMARAAIVALALTGCGGEAATIYGGPPPETAPPSQTAGDESETDTETDTEAPEAEPEEEFVEGPPVPIYGAPAPAPEPPSE